jgi:hypothetical protein
MQNLFSGIQFLFSDMRLIVTLKKRFMSPRISYTKSCKRGCWLGLQETRWFCSNEKLFLLHETRNHQNDHVWNFYVEHLLPLHRKPLSSNRTPHHRTRENELNSGRSRIGFQMITYLVSIYQSIGFLHIGYIARIV